MIEYKIDFAKTDVTEAAQSLVSYLGAREAWIHAAMNAVQCYRAGNLEDYEVWRQIAYTLAEWGAVSERPACINGSHPLALAPTAHR